MRANPALAVEGAVARAATQEGAWGAAASVVRSVWEQLRALWRKQHSVKQLWVCETLALGERRMLAVVEWNGRQLLLGGTATSFTLLAEDTGSVALKPGNKGGSTCP